MFRGKLLCSCATRTSRTGCWTGGLSHLAAGAFGAFLQPLYEAEWNVYAKPPTAMPSKC